MNILIDTDIGCDCDDAGAFAVLHALLPKTESRLLAVTCSSPGEAPPRLAESINRFYGVDVPVGCMTAELESFTDVYAARLTENESRTGYPTAVSVMRRALSVAPEHSVVFIGIGGQSNMAGLMRSPPDDIDILGGAELLKSRLAYTVVMGGRFADDTPEWNIVSDIAAARVVAEEWPGEIIYCGHEVGENVMTGGVFFSPEGELLLPEHPVAQAYYIHSGGLPRYSWDPVTVLAAMMPDTCGLVMSKSGIVEIDDNGAALFREVKGTRRYIYPPENPRWLENEINRLMLYNTKFFRR